MVKYSLTIQLMLLQPSVHFSMPAGHQWHFPSLQKGSFRRRLSLPPSPAKGAGGRAERHAGSPLHSCCDEHLLTWWVCTDRS